MTGTDCKRFSGLQVHGGGAIAGLTEGTGQVWPLPKWTPLYHPSPLPLPSTSLLQGWKKAAEMGL